VLVYGNEGLVGFLGGVDFNPDRVRNVAVGGTDVHGPLNDVHMRVTGDAATDLLKLAVDRWNFARPWTPAADLMGWLVRQSALLASVLSGAPAGPTSGRELDDLTPLLERAVSSGTASLPHHVVKVGQTVGNPDLVRPAANGVWPTVGHAIKHAKHFIYMEEQYFWSCPAAELLGEAAARVRHITMLLPPDDAIGERERFDALRHMKDRAGPNAEKIRIYVVNETMWQYVHSKVLIVDDELAIIGSANCNDRGYVWDSEVNAAVADHPWQSPAGTRHGRWSVVELGFARKLRIQLWQKYLRRPAEELVDGEAAEVHWRVPTGQARIADYLVDGRLWHLADYDHLPGILPPFAPGATPSAPFDWVIDPAVGEY
jgi:phosphatidylserine/phosphatidylglycerophosphate/cardiolipin synthase-like enzyme